MSRSKPCTGRRTNSTRLTNAIHAGITELLDFAAVLTNGTITVDGDPTALAKLVGLLAPVDPAFNIVIP